jgi:hypothetical protein
MHTLHTRASQIFKHATTGLTDQKTSNILWYKCWWPILQGKYQRERFFEFRMISF